MNITFDGYEHTLVPGRYYVKVKASSYSLPDIEVTADFTVVNGAVPAAPVVTADKAAYSQGEDVVFTIDTTGADRWFWEERENAGGDKHEATGSRTVWQTRASIGHVEHRFAIRVNGVWSEFATVTLNIQ